MNGRFELIGFNLLKGYDMKQLTDTERLEVAMTLFDDEQVDAYAEQCAELEREGIPLGMKPLLEQDCGDGDDGYGTVDGGRAPLD